MEGDIGLPALLSIHGIPKDGFRLQELFELGRGNEFAIVAKRGDTQQ